MAAVALHGGGEVLGVGMVSPIGLNGVSTAAAVRAGITRFRETEHLTREEEPLVMSLVADEYLPPLAEPLQDLELLSRHERMLKLAGLALRECLSDLPWSESLPLFLGLPEVLPGELVPAEPLPPFLDLLAVQSGRRWDKRSRLYAAGRAAGMVALQAALELLGSGKVPCVIVGGVDSYLDEALLALLRDENRLRAHGTYDGFIPGEGAAFLMLALAGTARKLKREPLAKLDVASIGKEPGHRYSREVYRGEGLAATFRDLFESAPSPAMPVRTVYAGLTGEGLHSKEWGVAYLRHQECFSEAFQLVHPADCLGDPGAALGPLMLGLAALGMRRGYRASTCLVWCSSDLESRGAALLSLPPPSRAAEARRQGTLLTGGR
ncbi:beta-ketoacyl synthase N-terminal-like domain-containing protein [Archangium lansingense]|uniref:beta-ketoacyl synthase N-terminal-like domain-containing protein n=1 Tax=Archangium lansingense TaxID=2995310 RepID=UPI003B78FF95